MFIKNSQFMKHFFYMNTIYNVSKSQHLAKNKMKVTPE